MQELGRIVDSMKDLTRAAWKKVAPQIISQAHLEEESHSVRSALTSIEDFKGVWIICKLFVVPEIIHTT